jgi:hypothetical protein
MTAPHMRLRRGPCRRRDRPYVPNVCSRVSIISTSMHEATDCRSIRQRPSPHPNPRRVLKEFSASRPKAFEVIAVRRVQVRNGRHHWRPTFRKTGARRRRCRPGCSATFRRRAGHRACAAPHIVHACASGPPLPSPGPGHTGPRQRIGPEGNVCALARARPATARLRDAELGLRESGQQHCGECREILPPTAQAPRRAAHAGSELARFIMELDRPVMATRR